MFKRNMGLVYNLLAKKLANDWQGYLDSNQEMTASEAVALPFGDTPKVKSTFCNKSDLRRQDFLAACRKNTSFYRFYVGRYQLVVALGKSFFQRRPQRRLL